MPSRTTGILLILFAIAAVSFTLGLMALGRRDDMMAILLGVLGALSLRALHVAARIAERGSR